MSLTYKGILFLSLALFFSVAVKSQSLDFVFEKYAENNNFRYVSISKGMVNLANFFGKGNAGNNQMLSQVDLMKVLTLKAYRNSEIARKFFEDVEKSTTSKPRFESLMEARENGVFTRILSRKNKYNKTDILIISMSDSTQHYIWLNGKISIEELQKMIKK